AFTFFVRFPFAVQLVPPPAVIVPVNSFALVEVRSALRARVSPPPLVVSLPPQCPVNSSGCAGSPTPIAHFPASHAQCAHLPTPSSPRVQISGASALCPSLAA